MSPEEIAELYRIALAKTEDPSHARRCVEAYLAGQSGFRPITESETGSKSRPKVKDQQ